MSNEIIIKFLGNPSQEMKIRIRDKQDVKNINKKRKNLKGNK